MPETKIESFLDNLVNIFEPIFSATIYPNKHPEIYRFLLTIKGFDFTSNETLLENLTLQ